MRQLVEAVERKFWYCLGGGDDVSSMVAMRSTAQKTTGMDLGYDWRRDCKQLFCHQVPTR